MFILVDRTRATHQARKAVVYTQTRESIVVCVFPIVRTFLPNHPPVSDGGTCLLASTMQSILSAGPPLLSPYSLSDFPMHAQPPSWRGSLGHWCVFPASLPEAGRDPQPFMGGKWMTLPSTQMALYQLGLDRSLR